jgi:putative endonuclease
VKRGMNKKNYFVYILASKKNGTLYTGVTSSLKRRVFEHKEKKIEGFTKKYNIDRLVYYELYTSVYRAINREKNIKKWNREWKIRIIEELNPKWSDLYNDLF